MGLLRILRHFRVHPRLVGSIALAVAVAAVSPRTMALSTRVILALDAGGISFLVLVWSMMFHATPHRMRLRARLQDEAKVTILSFTAGATIFSMAAICLELRGVKDLAPAATVWHIALAAGSIVCSWLVAHTMFALHYAHAFYGDGDGDPNTVDHAGGLDFPGSEHPDYGDFLYFAFVIAMTAQTSDVQITKPEMRRLTLAHSVLSFFFNTVILALSVNIAAGLL